MCYEVHTDRTCTFSGICVGIINPAGTIAWFIPGHWIQADMICYIFIDVRLHIHTGYQLLCLYLSQDEPPKAHHGKVRGIPA
jgi:hypothetical protein